MIVRCRCRARALHSKLRTHTPTINQVIAGVSSSNPTIPFRSILNARETPGWHATHVIYGCDLIRPTTDQQNAEKCDE